MSDVISEHARQLIERHRDSGLPTPSLDHQPVESVPMDIDALLKKMWVPEREAIDRCAIGVISAGYVARMTRVTEPAVCSMAKVVQADWLNGMLNIGQDIIKDFMQGDSWKLPYMGGQAKNELDDILIEWRLDRKLRARAEEANGGAVVMVPESTSHLDRLDEQVPLLLLEQVDRRPDCTVTDLMCIVGNLHRRYFGRKIADVGAYFARQHRKPGPTWTRSHADAWESAIVDAGNARPAGGVK